MSRRTDVPELDESADTDGVAALAGSAVVGLLLAFGFVALMAKVNAPAPAVAEVASPPAAVAPADADATPTVRPGSR